jgi:carbonic anhydrase/acetyltransferase-like protein (isoleucine patch superfamily)
MMYAYKENKPEIRGSHVYIHETAVIIGSVIIEDNVNILPHVVIRADNDVIHIHEGTNVQDGAVLHTDFQLPMHIGKYVTIAHNAVVHGCTIEDCVVVGIGAVVLNKAYIAKESIVGANAVIRENERVPSGTLYAGVPAKFIRDLTEEEREALRVKFADHYIEKIGYYKNSLIRIG